MPYLSFEPLADGRRVLDGGEELPIGGAKGPVGQSAGVMNGNV